ncbi:M15 family metallopeptidase [Planktosalinus lacus]|nr:M15 family metallopeptidase [Planktosalinus lacus]
MKFRILLLTFCLLLLFSGFSISKNQTENPLVDITELSSMFYLDIRYATANNFLKEPLYDCAKCLLLPEVAEAVINASYYFCDRGYALKFFDCYRPLSVQKQMWEKVPNPIYVADPAVGSVHNRGAAVDVTLATLEGEPVAMGTDYDFFGKAAHIDNFNLPEEVLANRKVLQEGMLYFSFATIQSEWWHFNYKNKSGAPVMDAPLSCK